MTLHRSLSLLLAASNCASAGDAKAPIAPVGDWEFSLSAGPAWRQAGTLNFSGGSLSDTAVLPSFVGSNSLTVPPIGSVSAIGDRFYDDGFVRTDPSTAIDGYTGFWGYQQASQVAGDTLTMHATGYQSIRSDTLARSAPASVNRHERGIAPFLQFDATYRHEINGFRPGLSASFSWIPVKLNRTWSDFALTQRRDDYRHDWKDEYNLGGFGNLIPSAPYAGTAAGPGFMLENLPDSRTVNEVWIGSDTAQISNTVTSHIRADHSTLSLGPTLERQIAPDWNVEVGTGISLHWLYWSASQSERLSVTQNAASRVINQWDDSSRGNKILGGLYLQIAADWQPKQEDWSLKFLLRGDLGQSFSKTLGASRLSYDVDGFTAAVLFSHAL